MIHLQVSNLLSLPFPVTQNLKVTHAQRYTKAIHFSIYKNKDPQSLYTHVRASASTPIPFSQDNKIADHARHWKFDLNTFSMTRSVPESKLS